MCKMFWVVEMWKCVKCCVEIRSVFHMLGFEVAKRRKGVVLGCKEMGREMHSFQVFSNSCKPDIFLESAVQILCGICVADNKQTFVWGNEKFPNIVLNIIRTERCEKYIYKHL